MTGCDGFGGARCCPQCHDEASCIEIELNDGRRALVCCNVRGQLENAGKVRTVGFAELLDGSRPQEGT